MWIYIHPGDGFVLQGAHNIYAKLSSKYQEIDGVFGTFCL